ALRPPFPRGALDGPLRPGKRRRCRMSTGPGEWRTMRWLRVPLRPRVGPHEENSQPPPLFRILPPVEQTTLQPPSFQSPCLILQTVSKSVGAHFDAAPASTTLA